MFAASLAIIKRYPARGEPVMRRVTINGQSYAAPFQNLFRPHTESELSGMTRDIEENGVLAAVIVGTSPTHGRIVIDGATRAGIAERFETRIPVADLGEVDDAWAEDRAIALNVHRRHSNENERAELLKLVKNKRMAGMSIRGIAREVGKPPTAIQKMLVTDMNHNDTADDDLPFADEIPDEPFPQKVTGLDGKRYPISRVAKPAALREPDELDDAASELLLRNAKKHIDHLIETVQSLLVGPRKNLLAKLSRDSGVPIRSGRWYQLEAIRDAIYKAHAHG